MDFQPGHKKEEMLRFDLGPWEGPDILGFTLVSPVELRKGLLPAGTWVPAPLTETPAARTQLCSLHHHP